MPIAGLSFTSPLLDKMDVDTGNNPYMPPTPTAGMGLANLSPYGRQLAGLGEALVGQRPQMERPKAIRPADVAIDRGTGELYVQGVRFRADDASAALEAEALLDQPGVGLPAGGNWEPLDPNVFRQYTQSIRNPSMGTLAARNIGRGVDVTQLLAGRGLQFLGAEETGGRIVAAQEEQLRRTAPYERMFTDIGEPNRGVLDWFVGNLAQQGPNLLLSALTGGGGALAGNAFARSAAYRSLARQMTSPTTQQSITAAAKKYAAGETLTPAEVKILHEAAGATAAAEIQNTLALGARNIQAAAQVPLSAGTRGAAIGLGAQGYATGVADIYGETIESGDPDRAAAAALGIPYAALESLTEFGVANQILKAASGQAVRAAGAGALARRVGAGAAVGGLAEGITEASQEGILLGVNEQVDWDSPEGLNRLVNSFAAGFGVGGPLGGLGGLASRGREPANLLNPAQTPEPVAATTEFNPPAPPSAPPPAPPQLPPGTPSGTQGQLFEIPGIVQADLASRDWLRQQLAAGTPATPQVPITQQDLFTTEPVQGDLLGGAPAFVGPQMPPAAPAAPVSATPLQIPGQGALQFGPPAPEGVRFAGPDTQMAGAMGAAQRESEIDQTMQQRAQREAAERDLAYTRALAQRERQRILPEPTEIPPAAEVTPQEQQLPLFRPRETPRPTRAERERAGVAALPEAQPVPIEEQIAERDALMQERAGLIRAIDRAKGRRKLAPSVRKARARLAEIDRRLQQLPRVSPPDTGQMGLFTSAGNPTVAALKGAGTRQPLGPPVLQRGARQAPSVPAEKIRENIAKLRKKAEADAKAADEARKQAEADAKAADEARKQAEKAAKAAEKLRKGEARAVQERGAAQVSAREPAKARRGVGAEVPAQPAAARKGQALRKGQEPAPRAAVQKQAPVPLKRGEPPAPKGEAAVAAAPAPAPTPARPTPAQPIVETPEEAWNNMAGDTDVPYASLPASAKTAWGKSKRTVPELDRIVVQVEEGTLESTNAEIVEFAVASLERKRATANLTTFEVYADLLVDIAYMAKETPKSRGVILEARQYLEDTGFTDQQRELIDQNVLKKVNFGESISAYSKGVPEPWFTYLQARNLLPQVNTVLTGLPTDGLADLIKNRVLNFNNIGLPAEQLQKLRAELRAAGIIAPAPARAEPAEGVAGAAGRLANLIRDTNRNTVPTPTNQVSGIVEKFKALYAEVPADQRDTEVDDETGISDFFDRDGNPKIQIVDKLLRISTQVVTNEELRARRAETLRNIAEARRLKAEAEKMGPGDYKPANTLEDWNTEQPGKDKGRLSLDDGTPITAPMAAGKIRIAVANFVRKLARKPTVHIYRNVEDLKAKNPRLYEQAVAARPQGDFDTVSAVGYSFGDGQVIIFSDRVATERQLKFVLAHETLGHFGFRGIMSERELANVMNMVYNSSEKIRAGVDMTMAVRKSMGEAISRTVAVEEYLADMAGTLDNNLLARVWSRIKDVLNKLGVRFDDDMARYVVAQARRYVRHGDTAGSFIDFRKIATEMGAYEGMQDPMGAGRYTINGESFGQANYAAADQVLNPIRAELNYEEFLRSARAKGVDFKDLWDRVMSELQTMNFASRENRGYRRLYEVIRATNHRAAKLRAEYNKLMKTTLSPALEIGRMKFGDATKEQIATTSRMLRITTRAKHGVPDPTLNELGNLVTIVDGAVVVNQSVLTRLKKMGRFTVEDFRRGVEYTINEPAPMTAAERTRLEQERDAAIATIDTRIQQAEAAAQGTTGEANRLATRYVTSLKNQKTALNRSYRARIDAPTFLVQKTKREPAIPGLTEDSPEWKMYVEVRDTMDRSAIDMLKANYAAARAERDNILRIAERFLGRELTNDDRAFIDRIENRYLELRDENPIVREDGAEMQNSASLERANEFIARFNQAVLGLDTDLNRPFAEAFFPADDQQAVVDGIQALKAGSNIDRNEGRQFAMQQAIQNLSLFELSRRNAELYAMGSIAGGYVPLGREGRWQVRIVAKDPETGAVQTLSPQYRNQLLFMQTELRSDAESQAEQVAALFGDTEFDAEVLGDDKRYTLKKVKLVAVAETARQTDDNAGPINLNDVIRVLNKFSIALHPVERERLVVGLTQQDASARRRLQRSGNPGEDPNTIKYVSQHLESVASVVARKENQHFIDRLYDRSPESEELWSGSQAEYDRLKAARDAARADTTMPEQRRAAIEREFDAYHFTFVVNESTKKANQYKDRGQRLIEFLNAQRSVDQADFGSGELGSRLRLITTYAQMGLSPATAVLNYFSLPLNVLPALAGYNPKNGFGGGFGFSRTATEMTRALRQTANDSQSDLEYWDDLLGTEENPKPADLVERNVRAIGLTRAEAEFLRKEVAEGTMQAALTNSMLGSARGRMTTGVKQKGGQAIMGMFNYTEQAARRATGLAAFRMAYDRAIGEGKTEAQAFIDADKFAVDMIENTLGEYAMFNRPAMFRGGYAQFAFMYKMFVVNTVQLLKALPRNQKLLALGLIVLFAGLKNLPFAEDIFDLLDTIGQRLGLGPSALWRGSAEATLTEALDAIAPGLTPIIMRGLLNYLTPSNVADRVGMGNIIPGSGIGVVGAEVGREIVEITGPMGSFIQQSLATGVGAFRYGLETVGLVEDRTSLTSLLRTSPVTMLRAGADIAAYYDTGAIVSQKGYVVSENLHFGTYLTRALGFYPEAAASANAGIAVINRVNNYRKDIAASFYGKYVAAALARDYEKMRDVEEQVDQWNEDTQGTGLELTNFRRSAQRALREAQRPAGERFLRTLPLAARAEAQRTLDILAPDGLEGE